MLPKKKSGNIGKSKSVEISDNNMNTKILTQRPHKSATQLSFKQTVKFKRAYDYISLQNATIPNQFWQRQGSQLL
jgi:hypothetical protein